MHGGGGGVLPTAKGLSFYDRLVMGDRREATTNII